MMQFDHLFITFAYKADAHKAAKRLTQAGFTQGTGNIHAGQGTANSRFFFVNGFIELLYPNSALTENALKAEFLSDTTKPTHLYERLYGLNDASPFGVCLRPCNPSKVLTLPFSTWGYRPAYLPPSMSIPIANAPMTEPMWFYLPFASAPADYAEDKHQPLNHTNGCQKISHISLTVATHQLSKVANYIATLDEVGVTMGDTHHMNIMLDEGKQGKSLELSEAVRLRW